MPNNYFKFKQFTVFQDDAAMKVGTDGVFLGAWCRLNRDEKRVLDIGTGTGLIALMAAQRVAGAVIDAVEIDSSSTEQARRNVLNSPWSNRINLYNVSFQDFASNSPHKYTHIISNPPFFINSLKSDDTSRTTARHTTDLSYDDLIEGVCKLLSPEGLFSVIFPFAEATLFIALAAIKGLYCTRRTDIYGIPGGPLKRVALEFSFIRTTTEHTSIVIENTTRGEYTDQYKELTTEFYLKF